MKAESLGNAYLFPNSGGVDRILLSKCHFVPPRRRTSCLDTSVIDCWLKKGLKNMKINGILYRFNKTINKTLIIL